MQNYDFTKLSPRRFEQIVRDLLKATYGKAETFASGRDGGIDIRFTKSTDETIVVQCKRYSNFKNLISALRKEASKRNRFVCSTYILAISLDISADNKKAILDIFGGKIKNANDIITNSDLNMLLSLPDNHHVEIAYPELWIGSVAIHQKIFSLGLLQSSAYLKVGILNSLKKFVPIPSYYQLVDHYKKENVAILTGNPGVGKTTLSHAIIANLINFQNYSFIDISYRTLESGEGFIDSNDPIVFLIDDFLGRVTLDKGNSYLELLLNFIKRVEISTNKKLIITSREYLLNDAKRRFDSTGEILQIVDKYIIEINSFTRRVRAEILHKHLNANLNQEHLVKLLKSDYKRIIDHQNFNPRIIDQLTNPKLLQSIQSQDYYSNFIENLEKPNCVWELVYNNLPNDLYKIILLNCFLISSPVPISELKKSILQFINHDPKFQIFSYDDFDLLLRDMEGSFFVIFNEYNEETDEEVEMVDFHNPSIIDFINGYIWNRKEWLILLIKNAIFFEQAFNLCLLEKISSDNELTSVFTKKMIEAFNAFENACFGYFSFDTDDDCYPCLKADRRLYYLNIFVQSLNSPIGHNVIQFIKTEIFCQPLNTSIDISEKLSFYSISKRLIELDKIKPAEALKHFLTCDLIHVEELVSLTKLLSICDRRTVTRIQNDKSLAKEVDVIINCEINRIGKMNWFSLGDFLNNFDIVSTYFPTPKSTERLRKLDIDKLFNSAYENMKASTKKTSKSNIIKEEYNDISDEQIINTFSDWSNGEQLP